MRERAVRCLRTSLAALLLIMGLVTAVVWATVVELLEICGNRRR